ncbi:MAG: hypothetical protein V2G42_02145 [bacterium JZ-2024 1]
MRRWVIIGIAFFFGSSMIFQFFLSEETAFGKWVNQFFYQDLNIWSIIIAGMALILSVGSMMSLHIRRIRRQEYGWGYSAVTLASLVAAAIIGIIWSISLKDKPTHYYFTYIFTPLDSTMFSLLAFFIASAAYRAFRARNIEATLMLATAIIVMMGQVTLGVLVYHNIVPFSEWFLLYPNMAAQRGLMIGIALGVVATSLKVILGIERPYLIGGGRK